MQAIVSFTVVPVGDDLSLSKYVAACIKVLDLSNLNYTLHANGTNIEGPWDEVFKAIKACQFKVHEMGSKRVFTTIQVGTRTDKHQTMNNKIESVMEKMQDR